MKGKLVIIMVGLPARGKSTMARKLGRTLELDGVRVRIFNNGDLRRKLDTDASTSSSEFFSPANAQGQEQRERISRLNIEHAQQFLGNGGEVAIMDASNVTRARRHSLAGSFAGLPLLFVECVNADEEALEANLERKAGLKEFRHLSREKALESFLRRIAYYESIYEPLDLEANRILVDSFESCI